MGLIIIICLLMNVFLLYMNHIDLMLVQTVLLLISLLLIVILLLIAMLVFLFRDVCILLVVLVVFYSAQGILLWMVKVGANVVLVIMKLVIHVSATLAPSL